MSTMKIVDGKAVPMDQDEEAAFVAQQATDAIKRTPEVGVTAPTLVASALSISVADGDIAGVEGIYGLAGAIYIGVGQYMLLFMNPQPDTDFYAVIGGGAPCMSTAEKDVDYLIIQAADAPGGAPMDASQFNVQIFRV